MEISSPRLQAEWHGRKGQSTGKSISLSSWSQLGIARSCESILAIGTLTAPVNGSAANAYTVICFISGLALN